MERLANAITRYMGLLIIVCSGLALVWPWLFLWAASFVPPLLGCIMFGMGMTLKPGDFVPVFSQPKDLFMGLAAQFICMPLLAAAFCRIWNLPPELALGVILVGAAPGGTASNVLTYIARGDVPYSVALTATATLASLLLMPLLTRVLGGVWAPVDMWALFLSILKIVVFPILLGMAAHAWLSGLCRAVVPFLPAFSALVITLTVAAIMAANAGKLLETGFPVLACVVCHNLAGLGLGWLLGGLWRFAPARRRALTIEIGTQNSGLAAALALMHFTPQAALAGAVFSVWQNIAGGLLANWFRNRH